MLNPALAAVAGLVERVDDDPEVLARYGGDWSRVIKPDPALVAFPADVGQVQALVRHANRERLALVPSGGRTGLSAGAVAGAGEVVVSFERMNRIEAFDRHSGSAVCQPGVITQRLQEFALEHGWFYPVDFGARGSSQIGGNIATNAGGIKVLRYGSTRNWITGLEVVTGLGDRLSLNHGLIKNATGYDLRHLFVGSEGTLGFIVGATVQFTRPPQQPEVMLLALSGLDSVMPVFGGFSQALSLNAFELFTGACLRHVLAAGARAPFASPHDYYVLLEFDAVADAREQVLSTFERAGEAGWVADGVLSENARQARELWRLREGITEAIAGHQPYKNDVAVPVGRVAEFLGEITELLDHEYPQFEVLCFGHVGDGNLHVNVLQPPDAEREVFLGRCREVDRRLFAVVQSYGGSISAEHGVGLIKKPYLHFSRGPREIEYMRALKQLFDPNGVMNPGKLFEPAGPR